MSDVAFAVDPQGSQHSDEPEQEAPLLVRPDPVGLAFDPRTRNALFVADGYTGAIVRVEAGRQQRVATIDAGGVVSPQRIAGIATTPFGALYASRVGQGRQGAIFRVGRDGDVERIDHVAPEPWRGGLAYDAVEHALYSTQYLSSPRGPHDGAVVVIDLVGGQPSMVIDGFGKPVGVAKLGSNLIVSDARQCAVYRVPLVRGRGVGRFQLAGDIGRPGAVTPCGDDSVIVAAFDDTTQQGAVYRLWLDGRRAIVARGAWDPRGIATDGRRVLIACQRAGRVLIVPLV